MAVDILLHRNDGPEPGGPFQRPIHHSTLHTGQVAEQLIGQCQPLAVRLALYQGGISGGTRYGRRRERRVLRFSQPGMLPQGAVQDGNEGGIPQAGAVGVHQDLCGGGEGLTLFPQELRLLWIGEEHLHHPLLTALGIEVHHGLRQTQGGGGTVVVGLTDEPGSVVVPLGLVEIVDAEGGLRHEGGEGVPKFSADGAAACDGVDGGHLLGGAAVIDTDRSLVVGGDADELRLDPVHCIGAQRIVVAHLITGVREILPHISLPVAQSDHAGFPVLGHQAENGVHQFRVGLHPHGGGVVGSRRQPGVGRDRQIIPLQHGGAAREGQRQTQAQCEKPLFHGHTSFLMRQGSQKPRSSSTSTTSKSIEEGLRQ